MCLTINKTYASREQAEGDWRNNRLRTASKNTAVWKVLRRVETAEGVSYESPYRDHPWPSGEKQDAEIKHSHNMQGGQTWDPAIISKWTTVVEEGLHAFTNEADALDRVASLGGLLYTHKDYDVCLLVIPAWSKYVIGCNGEVAASTLRWPVAGETTKLLTSIASKQGLTSIASKQGKGRPKTGRTTTKAKKK